MELLYEKQYKIPKVAAYVRTLLKTDKTHAELETLAKRFYSGYNNSDGVYRTLLAASRRMDAQVLKVMKQRTSLLH
ncbi:MAG: hypothetical protein LBL66_03210 [Clostridiales bacterium]|nr:hypothetical protein [Clostridiales bacterium]